MQVVAQATSALYTNDTTPLVPKFKIVDGATSGDNEIIAAVSGKKIRVVNGLLVMTGTAVTIRFESGAGGTALTGQMQPAAGNILPFGYCPVGHFETAAGSALNMELSGAQSVDGWVTYIEV